MKKLSTIIIGVLLSIIMLTPTMSLAFDGAAALESSKAAGVDPNAATTSEIDKIFKIQDIQVNGQPGNQPLKKLSQQVGSKQEFSFADVFGSIIKIFTGLAVVMTFVGAIVAGVIFLFSEGEEARTTKAKTILIYIAIGDLIMAASFAIVRAITYIKPLS